MKPPLLRPVFYHKNRSSFDNQLNTQDRGALQQYLTTTAAEAAQTPLSRPPLPPFYDRQRHYYNPQIGRGRRSIQSLDAAPMQDEIVPTLITPNGKLQSSFTDVCV